MDLYRALLKWLKTLLRKADAKILQISFPEMDEEDSLEEFLEAEGFFLEEDRETYSVPVKDLIYSEKLDEYQEGHRSSGRVVTLSELEKKDDFHAYIAEKEIPFEAEADRLSQSLVRINKEGKIDGCMLIFLRPDGDLEISYLSSTPAEGDVFELIMALQDLLLRMDDWREENILFTDRTGEIAGLIEELTGESSASYIATGKKEGILLL
ncbi:MAG: hypothetical protein K6F35_07300 [Lachnospiraceae bacterium]|nr:hypothetical protein [Lachnospiraceae bacterium]